MKLIVRFLFSVAFAILSVIGFMPKADAATFTELPLINNASAKMNPKDAEDLAEINQVYVNKIMDILRSNESYEMTDSNSINDAIEKYGSKDCVPSKESLMKIAEEGDVDVVFAMQIDEYNDSKLPYGREPKVLLRGRGMVVAYNRITGEYYKHKIYEDVEMEEIFIPRGNWKMEEFSRMVGREVRRVLKIKKFVVEKPRMSHF